MFYLDRILALETADLANKARLAAIERQRASDYDEMCELTKRVHELELKSALGYLNQREPTKEDQPTAFGGHLPFTARKRDYETRNQKKPEKKK